MTTPHEVINPDTMLPADGFAHVVAARGEKTIYLGGQTGHHADGTIDDGLVDQFRQACTNVRTAVEAAGSSIEQVVSLQIYCTDAPAYRDLLKPLGAAWRDVFGTHYPAIAFVEVKGLFDPDAKVELVATAVIP